MAGNVAEIVASCWQETLSEVIPDPDQGCRMRMIKDGAWDEPAQWQRPSARRSMGVRESSQGIGFRVVRDLR